MSQLDAFDELPAGALAREASSSLSTSERKISSFARAPQLTTLADDHR